MSQALLPSAVYVPETSPPAGGTPSGAKPKILGAAISVPAESYSQSEILDRFGITDERVRSVFLSGSIERRHLVLPPDGPDGTPLIEAQGALLAKHRAHGVRLAAEAVRATLKEVGADLADVGYLCCVTSTGFLTPGFSAFLIRELGLRHHTGRLDVVGMGCNAGLNGLTAVTGWATAHPGQLAVMVCVEVCSAAYVFDGTMRSSVVNSLFGDGAAALAVAAPGGAGTAGPAGSASGPEVLKFASCIIPDAIEAMRYDWDEQHGRFSFFLDRDIPYVVGAHAETVINRLLDGTGLRRSDIAHWVVHSGGKKVIDSVRVNLGLSRHDVRHTTGVLRDYGNVSSGSFIFSYQRLIEEGVVAPGEHAVLMTMGPGSTIETALVRF
ncbi:3,5-dihydroxyphenylacetyl-CoA synthase DpgA [Streptomyces angustmyceticus]|uniref:3,5-dihydroxyphenylacetyl-CoA synthase DpgA n=1 Tax=Streptomyces angustmyceticus TaxID=285578 RepID=UPI0021B0157B|nr:3,5-dihydroxyphenylacetyl-CoA synthase DpgA [Streptomyces angustmyceticus]